MTRYHYFLEDHDNEILNADHESHVLSVYNVGSLFPLHHRCTWRAHSEQIEFLEYSRFTFTWLSHGYQCAINAGDDDDDDDGEKDDDLRRGNNLKNKKKVDDLPRARLTVGFRTMKRWQRLTARSKIVNGWRKWMMDELMMMMMGELMMMMGDR